MCETLFLRFADAAAARAALAPLGLVDATGGFRTEAIFEGIRIDCDVLFGDGVIWRSPPVSPSADGAPRDPEAVIAAEPIPGFHVNLLWWGDTPPDFGPARIVPVTPTCVFA